MIASEVIDDGVHITTIYMPLVRTPMIAPTRMYDMFPTITPEEAAEMIAKAMITKPKKVATRLGNFGELLYAVAPKAARRDPQHRLQALPRLERGQGQGQGGRQAAPRRRRSSRPRASPSPT